MLLDAISKAGTIALGGHVRPDGDCAGSCMGLYNYVRENFPEKEIDVYLEELPNTLKFMKNTDKIRHEVTEEKPMICLSHWIAGIWEDLDFRQSFSKSGSKILCRSSCEQPEFCRPELYRARCKLDK